MRGLAILVFVFSLTSCSLRDEAAVTRVDCPASDIVSVHNGSLVSIGFRGKPLPYLIVNNGADWIEVVNFDYRSADIVEYDGRFEFRIDSLTGRFSKNGQEESRLVFQTPGDYQLYFADNIETEPENATTCIAKIRVL